MIFQSGAMVLHVRKAAKKECLSRRRLLSMCVCVCVAVHICMHSDLGGYKRACLMFLCLTVCPTGTPYIRSGGVPLNESAFVLSYSRGTILIISSEKTGSNFAPTGPECYTVYLYEKELSANLRTGFPFRF